MAAPSSSSDPQTGAAFFTRIKEARGTADVRSLYDDWAAEYDADLTHASQRYDGPAQIVRDVVDAGVDLVGGQVLDAGCGTGLVGVLLAKEGATVIDGVDLSSQMLDRARQTGVYRTLATADLLKPIRLPDDTYDAVTCVGTFTQAHVGPVPALEEFVRVAKKGGVVAATIREDIWESDGYKAEVARLGDQKLVDIISTESKSYRAGHPARCLVLKKR